MTPASSSFSAPAGTFEAAWRWRWPRAMAWILVSWMSWNCRSAEPLPAPDIGPPPALSDLPGVMPADPVLIKSLGDATELVRSRPLFASADEWARRRSEAARRFRGMLGLDPWPGARWSHAGRSI